tara:strand:- start:2462 stop:3454 length:993 start_codon:yes stop_codon:yes gene_type:complete
MIINENIIEILNKYLASINNYNDFFFTTISINKNIKNIEVFYIKGIILINNIFNFSLLYVDSLIDIYNLCEKGYIYFVEFLNQICLTNYLENNSFELTMKDAIIFSYKKTIFTIDSSININISDINNYKLNIINEFIYIINNISIINSKNLYNFINTHNNDKYKDKDIDHKDINDKDINHKDINYKDINGINSINSIINNNINDKLKVNNINEMLNKESQYINKFIKKLFLIFDLQCKKFVINDNLITYLKNINTFLFTINNNYKDNYDIEYYKNIILLIEKYIIKKIFYKNIFNDNLYYKNMIYNIKNNKNINDNDNDNDLFNFNQIHI